MLRLLPLCHVPGDSVAAGRVGRRKGEAAVRHLDRRRERVRQRARPRRRHVLEAAADTPSRNTAKAKQSDTTSENRWRTQTTKPEEETRQ